MDSAQSKIEALEAVRATRKAAIAEARTEQRATDLEALNGFEIEHGDGSVVPLQLPKYVKGLPTMVIVKSPEVNYYKRFTDKIYRAATDKQSAKGGRDAQEELGMSCWIYPADPETRKAMLEEWPGLPLSLSVAAQGLADAKAQEEGKA